jgi:superfamily II DNA helicase RecQ
MTISPLLSLSADQVKKIMEMARASTDQAFKVYHLDELSTIEQQQALTDILFRLSEKTTTRVAISLFVSPQAVKKEPWIRNLIDSLLKASLLRFICLDEIHIFLEHALNFRDEFSDLKSSLFKKLQVEKGKPHELLIPVLSMTATADKNLVDMAYPRVTGMSVPNYNDYVSWPGPENMQRRNVFVHVEYKEQTKHAFKTYVATNQLLQKNQKSIYYTNYQQRSKTTADDLKGWLDETSQPGDVDSVE